MWYTGKSFPFTFSVLLRLQLQFCVGFHEESFDTVGNCVNRMVRYVIMNKE